MSYERQNFSNGQILLAENLNHIEEGIAGVWDAVDRYSPVVCESAGKNIALIDSAKNPLHGLRLFGRTTQNGTPTQGSPIPLVSAGNNGSINISVDGKNIADVRNFSATKPEAPTTSAVTSNQYGTDISGTVGDSITVTQSKADDPNPISYQNGFFYVGFYCPLRVGDRITVSFDYEISENPLGVDGEWLVLFLNKSSSQYAKMHGSKRYHTTFYINSENPASTADGWNYLEVRVAGTSGIFSNIQVELGSTATEYEPHREPQTFSADTKNGLRGIVVDTECVYIDENGQRWICDEKDYARGVLIRRIGAIERYAGETIPGAYMSSTGSLSTGAFVQYILPTPVEEPIPANELAAYKELHTNKPSTTIRNDAGAHMFVEYGADTKAYIDRKTSGIIAATVE